MPKAVDGLAQGQVVHRWGRRGGGRPRPVHSHCVLHHFRNVGVTCEWPTGCENQKDPWATSASHPTPLFHVTLCTLFLA